MWWVRAAAVVNRVRARESVGRAWASGFTSPVSAKAK